MFEVVFQDENEPSIWALQEQVKSLQEQICELENRNRHLYEMQIVLADKYEILKRALKAVL